MIFFDLKLAADFFPVWTWRTQCNRPASLRLQKGPEVTIGAIGAPVDGLWWHNDDQPKLVILRGWPAGFIGPGQRSYPDKYNYPYSSECGPWYKDRNMVEEYIGLISLPGSDSLP